MKFSTKLSLLSVLTALCMSAHADGWLHNDQGYDNSFYMQSWSKYMGPYNLSVQPKKLDDGTDRAWYWVGGYQHCSNGVFFLEKKEANGELSDLVFASLKDAQEFETNLNRAIYPPDATFPNLPSSVFGMSLAGGLQIDQIALPYHGKDPQTGADSIQLHFLKSDLPPYSCSY